MPKYVKAAVAIMDEVKKAVIGKDDCVKKIMAAILAGGHILIEDIPGVGKTTLAVAFSRSMGLAQNRIQFTPDEFSLVLSVLKEGKSKEEQDQIENMVRMVSAYMKK